MPPGSRMNHPLSLYPAVLEHAAALIGKTPWNVSRDGDLLFEAHRKAHKTYGHSPVVCGIDVYHTEVECWGAKVLPSAGGTTPALGDPPLPDALSIPALRALDPLKDGRFPMLLHAAARLAAELPGVGVNVPVAGPVSIMAGLMGFETVLLEFAEESNDLRPAIEFLARHQAALCRQLLMAGFTPIIYESGAAPPLISPALFRDIVAPELRIVLAPGVELGKPLACIVGGDVATVAADLLAAGPCMVICPAETDQQAFMRVAAEHPQVSVRLNLPARLFAGGEREALFAGIDRLLPLALCHPRGLLGTGVLARDCDPGLVRDAQAYTLKAAAQNGSRIPKALR